MDPAGGGALLQDVSAPPDLEALYTRHHRLVRWIVRCCGVPDRSVDDVIQDVFVAIHRRRAQAPEGDPTRWIVGVTRSVCHSHRRAAARRDRRLALQEAPEDDPAMERWVEGRRAADRLVPILAAIDPAQREAWVLVELEGWSAPEVAQALGCNLNTVYSRVRLARRRIEAAFSDPDDVTANARRDGEPSEQRTRGVLAAVVAKLSLPGAGAVATAATSATSGAAVGWLGGLSIGAALGAGVLGAIVWARTPVSSPSQEPVDRFPVTATRDPAPPIAKAPVRLDADPGRDRDPVAAPPVREAQSPIGDRAPTPPSRRAIAPSAPASAQPTAPAQVHDDDTSLARETQLLRDAARSLDAGRLDEGEQKLAAHARDHHGGALERERQRLESELRRMREAQASP